MTLVRGILTSILLLFALLAQAQDDWENDGEIEDVEIEIVKDREIKLPSASRNFEKIAPVKATDDIGEIEYFYNAINFDLPTLNLRIRPLRIKDQPLNKLYGNYVKAGFGNYVTPYLEGYFNSKRNENYIYGAHINYLNSKKGPVDDENSGSGKFDMDLNGKLFGRNATLSGNLGYSRRNYHFYGYEDGLEVKEDSIKQIFNTFYVSGAVENTDKASPLQYKLRLKYSRVADDYDANEGEFQLNLNSRYNLSEEAHVKLLANLSTIKQQDQLIEVSRNLFRLKPLVGFNVAGFDIEAGFNVVYEDDTLQNSEETHFYPLGKVTYPFTDNFQLYAGIGGDIEKGTFRGIVDENPFIQANQRVFHTNKTFEFYGGINGKVSSKAGFSAGLSIANYQNMYYFINDPAEISKFLVIYDTENTAVVNLFGELSWTDENFRTTVRGDYWGYDANTVEEAWHKPNYELSWLTSYNLFDKILLNGEIFAIGGIKALDPTTLDAVKLDAAFDLNLKADYLVSSQFSAFVQFNNIFSKNYEILYRYPGRGLQFMLGATYSF